MSDGRELVSLRRVFSILVVTLTLSLIAAFVYIKNDTREDRIKDLVYSSSVLKEYYDLSFHQWELSLLSVGQRLIELPTNEERMSYAGKALQLYENELLAFGLAKPEGQIIMFKGVTLSDSLPNLMESRLTRRSFELAKNRDNITLGECYYFKNVEDWILPIRMPIYNNEGELIAVNTSAINYTRAVGELKQFGFDDRYQIHLINKDFGTTQILFPLDSSDYNQVLGNDTLEYLHTNRESFDNGIKVFEGVDPLQKLDLIGVKNDINIVNHQIVISAPISILMQETFSRFKVFLIVYLTLLGAAFILYVFVRNRMKKSLLELQSERANLKSIVESTEDYIGFFDKESRLIEYNNAFAISAKATDDIDVYKGIDLLSELKAKEQVQLFKQNFERSFLGEKFTQVIHYPGPEGEIIYQFNYNPIYRNEEVIGLSLFARDITDVKKAQIKLEEYNRNLEKLVGERTEELELKNRQLSEGYEKLKSTQEQLIRAEKMASLGVLAAGIGHEINNPLNFIKHGAEGLEYELKKSKGLDLDRLSGYFNAISEGVRRAADIVSDIANFSRESADQKIECDIHEILKKSLKIASTRFKDKQIEVALELECDNPFVNGDDGKLHQLFTNIIVNAEQAIDRKGKISIGTKSMDKRLVVSISDDGKGMSKKTITRITDPFFTTKEPGEGTGLGLFISQIIVGDHQGNLEVLSKEGEGSTFIINLPQAVKSQ